MNNLMSASTNNKNLFLVKNNFIKHVVKVANWCFFLKFHLVDIIVFKFFLGQKLEKLQIVDFERIWDFSVFPIF